MTLQTETSQTDAASSRVKAQSASSIWLRRFTALAPLWTLLILAIFFSIVSPNFARPINLNNILAQISTLAIFSTGMTFVLLLGEIDLSIAAMAGLSGMIAAYMYVSWETILASIKANLPILQGPILNYIELNMQQSAPIILALVAATLLGLVSGLASTRFRIPTFMSTLAMSLIAGGLNTYFSKGRVISDLPEFSTYLGSGRIGGEGGFRVIIIVAILTLLVGYVVLRYTRFGRYVYMTGASGPSRSAARLVGVNTDRVLLIVMTICGFTAGLAGIVSMGRLGSAQPIAIPSFLIDTIGAVVLGGTALSGGRGGIPQTVIGLLLYGTLRNGLDNMPQIDIYLKDFITGLVLLAALVVNILFAGRAQRDKTNA